ncbi:unnamed protein product [Musa acuminata subsp. burmannicoides]
MCRGYLNFYKDCGSAGFEGCEVTAAGQYIWNPARWPGNGAGLLIEEVVVESCSAISASGGPMSDSSVVLAACSLTSEESNNHPAGHHVSNCSTNGENNHEDDVSSPNPSEPDISDAEEKTVPLSGKPFFSIIMSKSQVQRPYQLAIPKKFWPHLPNTCVPLTLHFKKKIWEMRYYGDRAQRRFDGGWKHFVNDNNLKIGDCCFFELMDDTDFTFRVQLLRGDLPAECLNNGLSSDRPILID